MDEGEKEVWDYFSCAETVKLSELLSDCQIYASNSSVEMFTVPPHTKNMYIKAQILDND